MGKRKRSSKKDKRKKKKRKVESSSSESESESSSSETSTDTRHETMKECLIKLIDRAREEGHPLSEIETLFKNLNNGETLNLKYLEDKKKKKLLTKLFWSARLKEKKRNVWKISKHNSLNLLHLFQENIPAELDVTDAQSLASMFIVEDIDTVAKYFPDIIGVLDKKKKVVLSDDNLPKHFQVFYRALFDTLEIKDENGAWTKSRNTPANLKSVFGNCLKIMNKHKKKKNKKNNVAKNENNEDFGCALPPGFIRAKKSTTTTESGKDEAEIGPAMPKSYSNQQAFVNEDGKQIKGPAIPTTQDLLLAEHASESEEESSDDYGPANVLDGESMSKRDKRRLKHMLLQKEVRQIEEKYAPKSKKKRDDWMTVVPTEIDFLGSKNPNNARGFSTGAPKEADTSEWSMTAKEREMKTKKEAEIAAVMQKYKLETVQKKKKSRTSEKEEEKKRKQVEEEEAQRLADERGKPKTMFEAHEQKLKERIVIWEIKRRRGIRVGPRPGSNQELGYERMEAHMGLSKFNHAETHGCG